MGKESILINDDKEIVLCGECIYCSEGNLCFEKIYGLGYKKVADTDSCSYGKREDNVSEK